MSWLKGWIKESFNWNDNRRDYSIKKKIDICPFCNNEYTPPTCVPCTKEFCSPIDFNEDEL